MANSTIRLGVNAIIILSIILVIMSSGCEEKDDSIEIGPDTPYSIDIKANKGDLLYFKWESSGDLTWQLLDDNDTRVPGIPETIYGSERTGVKEIELFQNATYTLHFACVNEKTISIDLEWELR